MHRPLPAFTFLTTVAVLAPASAARADRYYNSAEPGCDGTDPTVVLCDDFEDGVWYDTNCDTAGGVANPDNDGWCGTIYFRTPANAVCGGEGAGGTSCAATSDYLDGHRGSGMMGDHDFGPSESSYRELYWRYYVRTSTDTIWSGEKLLSINAGPAGVGGIYFGGVASGQSGPGPDNTAQFNVVPVPEDRWRAQNQGVDLGVAANDHWYYVEIHILLNTPGAADGAYEVWMDDCGLDGLGCTGPGTLRTRHTDVRWVRDGDTSEIRSIWLENWGNNRPGGTPEADGSIGTHYYDQLVVATRRVGPMGVAPAPDAGATSDAGDIDAGATPDDAAASLDAGSGRDVALDAPGATASPGGCACAAARRGAPSTAWLAMASIAGIVWRRARRHARGRRKPNADATRASRGEHALRA